MMPNWPKLASLTEKTRTIDSFQFFGVIRVTKGRIIRLVRFVNVGEILRCS